MAGLVLCQPQVQMSLMTNLGLKHEGPRAGEGDLASRAESRAQPGPTARPQTGYWSRLLLSSAQPVQDT